MLGAKERIKIYDRIRAAMGAMSRNELAEKMKKSGHPITVKAISAWSSGIASPTSDTLIGLKKSLNVSTDWILTGEHPQHPDISKFEEILKDAKTVRLADIPDQDPDVSKILDIILSMPSDSRKKVIEFLELTTMRSKR